MGGKSDKERDVHGARSGSRGARPRGLSRAPEGPEGAAPPERTRPARFYAPDADIYETGEALIIVIDMPGVAKDRVEVKLESGILEVEGRIDLGNYRGLEPVYTEYGVGHFRRGFKVPDHIDANAISARIADGVLTVNLPKSPEARRRRIPVQ